MAPRGSRNADLGPTQRVLRSTKADAAKKRRDFWAAKGVLEDNGDEDDED